MLDEDETAAVPSTDAPLRTFCKGNWRMPTILLGVSSAAVLAFALRSYAAGDHATVNLSAWMTDRLDPTRANVGAASVGAGVSTASIVATTPSTPNAAPTDALGGNVRPVAATVRASFDSAARRIQPSTMAVRASYGTSASGQLLERAGSAVAVDSAGYAVTCTHVVVGATTISMRRFQEPNRWSPARVVASAGDLTLLQVTDGIPVNAATLGDSSRVNVGDWVLAVGHPFQLGTTVTAGIVSRRDVTLALPGGTAQTGLFQTDAAINEGSSGGPLVNVAGEVIGINSAIYAPTGTFSGAGFAIPVNQVREFVSSVLGPRRQGPSGWGLGLVALTPGLASELSFQGVGVVVSSVAPASAAERAQLMRGDVITKIAGVPVSDLSSAKTIRDRLLANEQVSIEFVRLGAVRTATLMPEAG